ncbi:MAG: hypothetical protein WC312_04930 [Candidatus Omnitrophota bacterium]|jgi:glucuronoxylan 4-O-methyltransferase
MMFKELYKRGILLLDPWNYGPIKTGYVFRKKYPRMLIDMRQIVFILRALKGKFPCNMLVFGLGWDALMWLELNRDGHTVFLEDDPEWMKKIMGLRPGIQAHRVIYPTKISDWDIFLDRPEKLQVDLPDCVNKTAWDVILVDGPCGCYAGIGKEPPGRMCSIYLASKLIRDGGDIFVDDCERIVEGRYADRYLGKKHFVAEVRSRTNMRRYNIGNKGQA